ncbi:MAG: triose-phosphate isomerase [Synergistaceae bacterium]|nr:triose-phosphate isomerase [Synergistota bacterium]NLM70617.1 triose-phosphate isomerase [Synergistaceae bacterium]
MEKKIYLYGNWKMNHLPADAEDFCKEILSGAKGPLYGEKRIEIGIFPPFISIAPVVASLAGGELFRAGAQDGWPEEKGAFTGAVSMDMILAIGCTHILVGHSERRSIFGETDDAVALKLKYALNCGLVPVLCFGETLEQREAGRTFDVIKHQLSEAFKDILPEEVAGEGGAPAMLLAYEPVWAIGTGRNAEPGDAQEACAFSREVFKERFGGTSNCPVLYGGSVKETNSAELLSQPDIDGALVGGASLKVGPFLAIYENYRKKADSEA